MDDVLYACGNVSAGAGVGTGATGVGDTGVGDTGVGVCLIAGIANGYPGTGVGYGLYTFLCNPDAGTVTGTAGGAGGGAGP
jgi:hypothetical protein